MMRQLQTPEEIRAAAGVIRQAFRTVADDFALTPENCPTHPAFLTSAQLAAQVADGLQLFGRDQADALVGVVGIKRGRGREFVMEKLAVLPACRHRGYGRQLTEYAVSRIREAGGNRVTIGIIDNNSVLKYWYADLGFKETGIQRFPHLPFFVCHMECSLEHDAGVGGIKGVSASPLKTR